MSSPANGPQFLESVRKSGLLNPDELDRFASGNNLPTEPLACAETFVRAKLLTTFQARSILSGRFRGMVMGPYRILRPLGKGGMGVVYLAEHTELERRVALKVFPGNQSEARVALDRFFREARAVAALDHQNIVRLHDACHIDGVHFLVMEFVDGIDLQSLLGQTGRFHYAQAVNYVAQAAVGLHHAHGREFIHRDIKPGNLMLAKDGTIKILDMGLARSVVNSRDDVTAQLHDGTITGTADFISPEQAMAGEIDARTDIYSLGATLYMLITGKPPYDGNTTQKLTQHQLAPPPDLRKGRPDLPEDLSPVLSKMMAKRPADRYQSAEEVLEALAPWIPGSGVYPGLPPAMPASTSRIMAADTKAAPIPLRQQKRVALAAGAVLILVAVGLWAAFGGKKQSAAGPAGETPPAAPGLQPNSPARFDPPAGPNPATWAEGKVVYSLDVAKVPPFRVRKLGANLTSGEAEQLPGVICQAWKPEGIAEFRRDVVGGVPALGITNMNEHMSGQFSFELERELKLTLEPGKAYRAKISYRTDNEGSGRLHVLTSPGFKVHRFEALPQTRGEWRAVAVSFVRPSESTIQITVDNYGVGEGNTLWLRSVEIVELFSP